MKAASPARQAKLWKLCQDFIVEQRVSCPEAVAQNDNVIENAYELIEKIGSIVGFKDD